MLTWWLLSTYELKGGYDIFPLENNYFGKTAWYVIVHLLDHLISSSDSTPPSCSLTFGARNLLVKVTTDVKAIDKAYIPDQFYVTKPWISEYKFTEKRS